MREAKAIAARQGRVCQNAKGRGLLYDFTVHLPHLTIAVRVRRTRLVAVGAEDLVPAYPRDIARLRRVPQTPVLIRELWVRTSCGTWQYFLVLDDRILEIPAEVMTDASVTRRLREDFPGPDRAPVAGAVPPAERPVCPFLVPSG